MKLALHFIFFHFKMIFLGVSVGLLIATAGNIVWLGVELHRVGVPVLPFSTYFQSK
jgi:hypothetical protein